MTTLNSVPKLSQESAARQAMTMQVRDRVAQVVVGQEIVVERLLIALLTGGHVLLEGMPGLAKTLLVNALARAVDLQFGRVQFTIDLLPSDILGTEILDQATGTFRIHKGPVFTNLLLADEINRAAPRVQSALLEAMQERRVTIGNSIHVLPVPFLVIATQNPVEQSGTFELPEAQLDRFMICHRLKYPSESEEVQILNNALALRLRRDGDSAVPETAFDRVTDESPVLDPLSLTGAMEAVQRVHVSEAFVKHTIELVHLTRKDPRLQFGASPRGGIALVQASRARAYLHGREFVTPDDLFALADDILRHRIRVTYSAAADGIASRDVLAELMGKL